MVPPQLHPHPHLHCLATGRLALKPLCCSLSASSARTPPPLHGPSLRRGRRPLHYKDPLARAFDLVALRVPAAACAPLERRLRGHLLNWPRVRNVVRLPNDQGLPSLSPSPSRYPSGSEEPEPEPETGGHAQRATAVAVARREKLVRDFNARGFLRFPNLARLSRPSPLALKKRRERKGDEEEATREPDKGRAYVVEVVGERGDDDDDDAWKGLVGFGRGAWLPRIGSTPTPTPTPTRLLLLDERYAVDELPEAVKDVLGSSAYELVRCHLTLFYNYWSMNELLEWNSRLATQRL